jgi:CheY-like chemotaxis protein
MPQKQMNFVLADDDPDDQELLIEALKGLVPSLIIETFMDGKEVVAHLRALQPPQMPSLIILDYNMPRVTGLDVLLQIAPHPQYHSIPKVVWSTSDNPAYIRECINSGAKDYFLKPASLKGYKKIAEQMISVCLK